jgi:tol-pal system beta propeller repeat protein TolB
MGKNIFNNISTIERGDMYYKKLVLLVASVVLLNGCFYSKSVSQGFSFQALATTQHSKIKCQILIDDDDKSVIRIAKIVKFDLEFTDQLEVNLSKTSQDADSGILSKLFKNGYSLCLELKRVSDEIHSLLKDTSSGDVIYEARFEFKQNRDVSLGHRISDKLIPELTGNRSVSTSALSFCKQLSQDHKVICLSDYSCNQVKTVVANHGLNVAPSWHSKASVLFFSRLHKTSGKLMSINMRTGKQNVICSYDGLNMQPSFSSDGSRAVLCMSARSGNSELYMYDQKICRKLKKRVFVPLTSNNSSNSSPTLLPDGNVIFCSDFETGMPQIYHMNIETKFTQRLTSGQGYSAAPSYNDATKSVVYTKQLNGTFQIFSLNLDGNNVVEKQMTFNEGDKFEPSMSECGKYIVFTYVFSNPETKKTESQIASYNCDSGNIRVLTRGSEPKSFPCWKKV